MSDAHAHLEHEDHAWTASIPDHAGRTETPWFRKAKDAAHKIMATIDDWWYGPGPYQMHHGGSVWVWTGRGWDMYRGKAGIEWSMQFIALPALVDQLRQWARALVDSFPGTRDKLKDLGYDDVDAILDEPITDAQGVARWTDCLFNSCVPLPAGAHTGVLPAGGGVHHYPTPITDAEFFKDPAWPLFVTDPATGSHVAVVKTEHDDGSVEVVHAPAGHPLHAEHAAAHAAGHRLVLHPTHRLAVAAHTAHRKAAA